ncbi:TPA: hypothetical protein JBB10_01485 [Legionella pneumophila subsp. pneumophila]|nr:hypothetical protein [Legionella pneumophila]MDI9844721.1 hypothetical protein [Legionella pneumophila]HAT2123407.1 hypothetical protein [Legionella pneumophila]HAT8916535.1 hypothetical protein [Legionella pneumophila subsp. pneumophila]
MGFKEVRPQRISASSNASNLIRVSFSKPLKSKKFNINIYIGIHIAEKIGLKADEKIKFYIDEDNPRLWLIKKANDGVGYKVIDPKKTKDSSSLRLQMGWDKYTPNEDEISVREVENDIYDGGIRIFANLKGVKNNKLDEIRKY